MAASRGRRPIWRVASRKRSEDPLRLIGNCRVFPAIFVCASRHPMSEARPRQGAFFGRRKGPPLRARQVELFGSLLPRLAIDLTTPAPNDLADLFPLAVENVRLAIGFGGAEHLIAEAQAHPRTGFIGCEPFVNGMAKALVAIDELGLANIRLHHGDALELLARLPPQALSRIDLLY